jgi:hypothetical protein
MVTARQYMASCRAEARGRDAVIRRPRDCRSLTAAQTASTRPPIDLEAVPGIGAESCSRWTGSGARRGCSGHTSRRNWSARLRTRGRCWRGRDGRERRDAPDRRAGRRARDRPATRDPWSYDHHDRATKAAERDGSERLSGANGARS